MKRLLLIALTAAFLAPASASADHDPLFYEGIPNATEYLKFLSGSGVTDGLGVQVGPYLAQFGSDPTNPDFSIYCVDYTHRASSWSEVYVTQLTDDISTTTRLADYGKYRQAAYLASLFDTADHGQWGEIHSAIWAVTNPGMGPNPSPNPYLTMSAPQSFTGAGWYVVTPTNFQSGGGQEFLMRTRVSVPEPSTLLLLGTGIVFFCIARRRRFDTFGENA